MNELEARVRVLELAQKHAPNHEAESDTCDRAMRYWQGFIARGLSPPAASEAPVQQPQKKVVAPKP